MAGTNDIVRRGYLSVVRNPKDGMLGSLTSTMSARRFWVVLRKQTPTGGKSRLELFRSEEQVSSSTPVREYGLDSVRAIQQADRKKAFQLQLPQETVLCVCSSRADMMDWVTDVRRFTPARDSSGSMSEPDNSVGQDLYEILPDDETFSVTLRKSSSLRFSGACLLEVLRDFDRNLFHIALFTDEEPPRLIVKWQIDHVRQYGSNQMAFKFQAGSKSPTGVDWFIVDTEPGAATKIHKSVDYWAKHIVDQVRNIRGHVPQRSHSVVSERSRSPTSSLPHPSSSLPGRGGGQYAALIAETRLPPLVYDNPNQPQGARSRGRQPTYQQLQPNSMDGVYDNAYQDLNRHTREPDPPRNRSPQPPSSGSSSAVYMGLNPSTQSAPTAPTPPSTHATYMGLNPSTRESAPETYMGLKDARS